MNILIAEDEPFVQDVLSMILRKAGHTVHLSSDGQEAWEAFQSGAFDVVMSDLYMPKLDGRELAAKLKATAPGQRIVLMSGEADDGVVPPNVDYLLAKPIRGTTLVDLLKRIAAAPLAVAEGGRRRRPVEFASTVPRLQRFEITPSLRPGPRVHFPLSLREKRCVGPFA